ncbi:hypothetical protein KQH30_13710, partial [Enterococcus faecium]|nr:hypothetical protein [Enterococcus faecium]MCK6056219.1 hypothetical protein [Enterococcus faecium]MCZ9358061.1 hypothetical protein [Enterococcus faecium]
KKNGWCYLSSIMDLHTKKIISYTFSKRMTVDCVIQTLNKAKILVLVSNLRQLFVETRIN